MTERHLQTPIMHRAVVHNGTVYLAGTTADDTSLGMRGQTEQILAKFDKFLAAAGSDKTKLLSVTIFIAAFDQKPEMDLAWKEWMPAEHRPTRATVGVQELGKNVLIEMTAIAAL
ncbi:RidA family protein [Rhodovarius lipocyclicus]|jgi:2-iminobutanoate/2-iminopropanoate deaminase|uniref:RidA family protein n=1 Tax=Rhodovarius lipocyclicus TaxID=268410 RepID=UPI001359CDA1|nr:RidA family protein [Rhodovarius lipocyclicus]